MVAGVTFGGLPGEGLFSGGLPGGGLLSRGCCCCYGKERGAAFPLCDVLREEWRSKRCRRSQAHE